MNAFQPRKILVPFDFSRGSMGAWRYAEALAARLGARLEAVYVSPWLNAPDEVFVPPTLTPRQRLEIERKLKARLGPGTVAHIAEGDVVAEILSTAKARRAELIVMSTAGRTGLRRALGGSVTEAVVRLSPIPVLSLRRAERALPRDILAPVNLEPYSMAGLRAARAVGEALAAPVTLLHVKEGGTQEALEALRELGGGHARIVSGKPVAEILSEAAKHDLVVLVAHRRGLFRDGLLGTTAEQVLRRCEAPVLCVPAQPRLAPGLIDQRSVMPTKRKMSKRRAAQGGQLRHTRARKRGTRAWTTWRSEARVKAPTVWK